MGKGKNSGELGCFVSRTSWEYVFSLATGVTWGMELWQPLLSRAVRSNIIYFPLTETSQKSVEVMWYQGEKGASKTGNRP